MLCLLQPTRPLVPCHLGCSPSLWFSSFRVASSFCLAQQPNSRNQTTPCVQKAPGQDLAQTGNFQRIPEGNFNCRAPSHQKPKIWLQKAPGQDLAQKGRFPRIPEGDFTYRAPSPQNPKIWLQKAPGQDLAQKGRFLGIPEGAFNCRPKGLQMAEMKHFQPKTKHFEAKMKHFEANMKHFVWNWNEAVWS